MLCLGIRNRSATRHLYVAEIPTFLLCYNRPESSLYVRFSQDKGQARAVREVIEAVRKGKASPFTLSELLNTSQVTFGILESIASGQPVAIERD